MEILYNRGKRMRKILAILFIVVTVLTGCGNSTTDNVGKIFYSGQYIKLVIVEGHCSFDSDTYILRDEYTGNYYFYRNAGYGRVMTQIEVAEDRK